jgi:glycosyltransferase involved in cell wall biosynthesis
VITISIPTYNRPDSLKALLNNLSNQNYRNFIVRISDNNSDNHTGYDKVIKEDWPYEIEYFRQKRNIGHIENFIFLVEKCDTEYHMWLADDDRINPDFLDNCMSLFTESVALVFSNYLKVYPSGKTEEIVISHSIKSNENTFLADCIDLLYLRHPKPGFYKKIGIYGIMKSSYLKKIVGYNLYKWHNERDLLFLLRQHGDFRVSSAFLFEKSVDDKMNLDLEDPYYVRVNERGTFKWLLNIVNFSKGLKYKVFSFFFILPLFLNNLLKGLK